MDQVIAMKKLAPDIEFHVLAPHDRRSNTVSNVDREHYHEHRFHYFWPFRWEKLAGRGILPALKRNPFLYFQIPFFLLFETLSLYRLARKTDPDILYAHWFIPQGLACAIVSSLLNVPFLFTTHASDASVLHKIPFGKSLAKAIVERASLFTAVSHRTAKKLVSLFDPKEWDNNYAWKLSIIPMGTELQKKTPDDAALNTALKESGIPEDRKIILFLGRLTEKKGIDYLIDAYARLPIGTRKEYLLVIAGDGEKLAVLREQVEKLNLEKHIYFTGYVVGQMKEALLHAAEIVAMPSIIDSSGDSEGLPVVLMESLSKGKLVIATNVSGAEEILTENCGVLINQKSSGEIADALLQLTKLDETEVEKQKLNAKLLSDQFAWPTVASCHLSLINKAWEQTK